MVGLTEKYYWVRLLAREISRNCKYANYLKDVVPASSPAGEEEYRCEFNVLQVDGSHCEVSLTISEHVANEVYDSIENVESYTHDLSLQLARLIKEECS